MHLPNFLIHLKDVAGSPLAFTAYIFVIALWFYFIWINNRNNAIKAFKNEDLKLKAYKALIKKSPPRGVDMETWYKSKLQHKRYVYLLVCYVATLITIFLVCTLATFYVNSTKTEELKTKRSPIVNSHDSGSFNKNKKSFNGQLKDSAREKNSYDKNSFNGNDSSFNQ